MPPLKPPQTGDALCHSLKMRTIEAGEKNNHIRKQFRSIRLKNSREPLHVKALFLAGLSSFLIDGAERLQSLFRRSQIVLSVGILRSLPQDIWARFSSWTKSVFPSGEANISMSMWNFTWGTMVRSSSEIFNSAAITCLARAVSPRSQSLFV